VGARCPECARPRKLPTYDVSKRYYLRAAGAALAAGIVTGLLWGLLALVVMMTLPLNLNLLLAPAAGYVIGEAVSRAVNRKRGRGLAVIGGGGMLLCYVVNIFSPWGFGWPFSPFGIGFAVLAVALGIYLAVSRLR